MRTLGEALESALASILNEGGEGAIAVASDAVKLAKSRKEAGTVKAPASQEIMRKATQPATKAASPTNGRPIVTASPTSLPRSAVAIGLVLEEAGRTDCPVSMQREDAALSPSLTPRGASAHETTPARRQAVRSLRVIEGGRPAGSGGVSRAAYARLPGGDSRSNLVVVGWRDH